MSGVVKVRPMEAQDVEGAREVWRAAFASFLKIPPEQLGDADLIGARFRSDPGAAFVAELDGQFIGSHFVVPRGSVAGVGPVTIRPTGWTGNAGAKLMEAVLETAKSRFGTTHAFGYTFAQSPGHVLYHQRHGFWPRFLTAHLSAPVRVPKSVPKHSLYSALSQPEAENALGESRRLTHSIFEGLDWSAEILHVHKWSLGETVFLSDVSGLAGFAICHIGRDSEAGTGKVYVKFAAVKGGEGAPARLDAVLDSVLAVAAQRQCKQLFVGVNTARERAYAQLMQRGAVVTQLGVSMARPNVAAYMHPEAFVLDDGR